MQTQNKYKAQPERLPNPTYWPFFLALGLVCIFWGILTTWIITAIGAIIFVIALSGWITDIYNELLKDDKDGM
ncbi:MAG: cytochrome c oxidase subunit 4 [Aequorivita sp.]